MLKPTTMFLETEHTEQIVKIAKERGLKMAQVVRIAIHEYLRQQARLAK